MIHNCRHIVLVIAVVLGLLSCSEKNNEVSKVINYDPSVTSKFINEKNSFPAGISQTLDFDVSGLKDQELVQLLCSNKWGVRVLESEVSAGVVNFKLDTSITKQGGYIQLQLKHKDLYENEYNIEITPAQALGKMEAFNGPKSLFANDDDGSMLVVIPKDEYGNPLKDGAIVHFSQRSTQGQSKLVKRPVSGLVSYNVTNSKIKHGKVLLGAQISKAAIEEQELLIEASMPAKLIIKTEEWYPTADERQNIHLSTLPIYDQYMNLVPDGTLINFTVRNRGNIISVYNGFTVNGVANIYIQNPSEAMNWHLQASLYGSIFSNILHFQFEENNIDYRVAYNAKRNELIVGPVTAKDQKLFPDGTKIKASIKLNGVTHSYTAELFDGYARFALSEAFYKTTSIDYNISINGNDNKGTIKK